MEKLRAELEKLIQTPLDADTDVLLNCMYEDGYEYYPFNKYGHIITTLLNTEKLAYDKYLKLRDAYIARNKFLYLYHFSNAPFASWAVERLKQIIPKLAPPSTGQYDLVLRGNAYSITIEVKASRAVEKGKKGSLPTKALSSSDYSHSFEMNFQQSKPHFCDVFVWVGVWTDVIRYWVIASKDLKTIRGYSDKQHSGNKGEGQFHLTNKNIEDLLGAYEITEEKKLSDAIIAAYQRQSSR